MFGAALDRTCRTCDDVEAVVEDGGRCPPLPDGGASRRHILLTWLCRCKSGCTPHKHRGFILQEVNHRVHRDSH